MLTSYGLLKNPQTRKQWRRLVNGYGYSYVPWAADADYWSVSELPTAGADKTTELTIALGNAPAWPVVPVSVTTDAADDDWTGVSIRYDGLNMYGEAVNETVAATNSSGTWTATGTVAFSQITRMLLTITGTAAANDTSWVGFVKTYGLGVEIASTDQILVQNFDNAVDAGTVSVPNQTIVLAGTPDAAKKVDMWIIPSGLVV